MSTVVFHLYVAGTSGYSRQILQFYEEACKQCLPAHTYRIGVIDILKKPELAEMNKVLATPTISRTAPSPEKRVIGKVNSEEAIVAIRFLTEDLST